MSSISGGLTLSVDDGIGETAWRCLGRRGMLYSECESFDYARLAPGASLDGRGRDEIEEVWFVLAGEGTYLDAGSGARPVHTGDLLICPQTARGHWRAPFDTPLELLLLAMMPASISRSLPPRAPVS
nr:MULTISPECIES: cupin domain-containing protein [Frankia]